ncbi:hypothetical protein Q1695_011830 [Nippostrongylus brasiliensis]|nr:hypothetical protein Q1695_011830 [Nippostrongylus brasiliensis]
MRVITFYKEQTLRSVPLLRDLGVYLATVDSIQGREMDVVIVLTTKTATATEARRSGRRTLRSGRRPGATTRSGARGRCTDVRRSLITVKPIHQAMYWDEFFLESSDDSPRSSLRVEEPNTFELVKLSLHTFITAPGATPLVRMSIARHSRNFKSSTVSSVSNMAKYEVRLAEHQTQKPTVTSPLKFYGRSAAISLPAIPSQKGSSEELNTY